MQILPCKSLIMKTLSIALSTFAICLALFSCDKKEDPEPEIVVNHVGEKWNIASVTYTLVNQDFKNPTSSFIGADNGTLANAGAFYFNSPKGSFDITIKETNTQDYFSYTESGTSVTVTSIAQSIGGNEFSQYVIALSGEKTSATTMTLEGSITRQSLSGQFVLTGTFLLQKN